MVRSSLFSRCTAVTFFLSLAVVLIGFAPASGRPCQRQGSSVASDDCRADQERLRRLQRELARKRTALFEVNQALRKHRKTLQGINEAISDQGVAIEKALREMAACYVSYKIPVAGPMAADDVRRERQSTKQRIFNLLEGAFQDGLVLGLEYSKMSVAAGVLDLSILNYCVWSYTLDKYADVFLRRPLWQKDRELTTEMIQILTGAGDDIDKGLLEQYQQEIEALEQKIEGVEKQVGNCPFAPSITYLERGSDPGVVAFGKPQVDVTSRELSVRDRFGTRRYKVPPSGRQPLGSNEYKQDTTVYYRWGQGEGQDPIVIDPDAWNATLPQLAERAGFDPTSEHTRRVVKREVQKRDPPYPEARTEDLLSGGDQLPHRIIRALAEAYGFEVFIEEYESSESEDMPPPTEPPGGSGKIHMGDHVTFSMKLRIPLFYPALNSAAARPKLTPQSDLWAKTPGWVPISGRKEYDRGTISTIGYPETASRFCEGLGEGKWNVNQQYIAGLVERARRYGENDETALDCLEARDRLEPPPDLRGERKITVGLRAYTEGSKQDIRGSFVRIQPRDRSARWITVTYKAQLVFTKVNWEEIKIVPTLWGMEGAKHRIPPENRSRGMPLQRSEERTYRVKKPYDKPKLVRILSGRPHPGPGKAGLRVDVRSEAYPSHEHDPSGTTLDGASPSGSISPVTSPTERSQQVGLVRKSKPHSGCPYQPPHPGQGPIPFVNNKIQLRLPLPPNADQDEWTYTQTVSDQTLHDSPLDPPDCPSDEKYDPDACGCVEKEGTGTGGGTGGGSGGGGGNGDGSQGIGVLPPSVTPNVEIGYKSLGGDDFGNFSGGLGGELGGHVPINSRLSIGGGVSLSSLGLNSGTQLSESATLFGVFVEPRYRPQIEGLGEAQPFVGAQLGLDRLSFSQSQQVQQQSFEQSFSGWGYKTELRAGVEYPLGSRLVLDGKVGLGFISFGQLSGTRTQNGRSQDAEFPSTSGRSLTVKVGLSYRLK